MARIPRVVVPGIPHHIVQRGNRRQRVFFCEEDFRFFIRLLKKYSQEFGLTIWAYCLMLNHFHLLAIPLEASSLSEIMAVVNQKYALAVNLREDWRGSLWQGRFYSCPLDHPHSIATARYIERNPVRAGIVERPDDYPWSSARAHFDGASDSLVGPSPITEEIWDWKSFISIEDDEETLKLIRKNTKTGRPVGAEAFVDEMEKLTNRILKLKKPGPKPKNCSRAEAEACGSEFGD